MQIQATSGVWQYGYNNPINSIAFTGDTGVLNVDFTNSDGLANITTLADAFKNCAALVAVDFTGCDLSNVATAADCFAGCASLAALTIPTGTWKPDIDLSACAAFTKAAMLAVIDGLYTYNSGTHTVTFNSTIWDALPVADQQQVYNAADAKGWTTNAVAVTYVIRGTSSKTNDAETFRVQFILNGNSVPQSAEIISCETDAVGNFEYSYKGKKLYSMNMFASQNTTLKTIEFTEELDELTVGEKAFYMCSALQSIDLSNATFAKMSNGQQMFNYCTALTYINLSNATFENLVYGLGMFGNLKSMTSIDLSNATFENLQDGSQMFEAQSMNYSALQTIDLSSATFANLIYAVRMFLNCNQLTTIIWSQNLNLENLQYVSLANNYQGMFSGCSALTSLTAFGNFKFNNLLHMGGWFWNCTSLQTLDLHSAEFRNVQTAWAFMQTTLKMQTIDLPEATFENLVNGESLFYKNSNATSYTQTINMPKATLAKCTNTKQIFLGHENLTTIDVPQNSTAILPTSTAANAPMDLHNSPLTYASMLKVANWLSDLTGYTAHTVTFNTTAWNNMGTDPTDTAQKQAAIDAILTAKNWTRVLA